MNTQCEHRILDQPDRLSLVMPTLIAGRAMTNFVTLIANKLALIANVLTVPIRVLFRFRLLQ